MQLNDASKSFWNSNHGISGNHSGFVPGIDGSVPGLVSASLGKVRIAINWTGISDDLKQFFTSRKVPLPTRGESIAVHRFSGR